MEVERRFLDFYDNSRKRFGLDIVNIVVSVWVSRNIKLRALSISAI